MKSSHAAHRSPWLKWVAALAGVVALAHAAPVDFTLPAQRADRALIAFSRQAKIDVMFPFDELRRAQSAEATGQLEPDAALNRLLEGTGYTAHRNTSGKFVVARAVIPPGSLGGRFLTTNGTPAQGVRVSLADSHQTVMTDEEGRFAFSALAPGSYRLVVEGTGFQPLQLTDAQVVSNRAITLETRTLQPASGPAQLAAFIVVARSVREGPFDRGESMFTPRTAAGNLDLPRSQDDALPYTMYGRDQIARSGVVNLNDFLQRELIDSATTKTAPDQGPSTSTFDNFRASSSNINLRGYGEEQTVILINGRRLPEVATSGQSAAPPPPDVNFIPLSLVERVEVMPVSASALYSGNAVGGVINIVLRSDLNTTEVGATYTNSVGRFDAPQSTLSFQHGQSLLGGKFRVRVNATFTYLTPPTEAELGYVRARLRAVGEPDNPHRATPNVRSADGSALFGAGTSSFTSVAPGADGTGGLAAFANRAGVRNYTLFDSPGEFANSPDSLDFPYGRRQRGQNYFGSAVYDAFPWLQLGLDGFFARTKINRGFSVFPGDLTLAATSPLNPFKKDLNISLNEIAPALGENYNEGRLDFVSAVGGAIVKLPSDWRVTLDAQIAHNMTKYRGLAGVDSTRWQQLVDQGIYNPLRDTQGHGPPVEFYDRALIYYGGRDRFVTFGNYTALDAAVRISNQWLPLPTGTGVLNVGGDYRRNHLDPYVDQRRYADGTLAFTPEPYSGRTLERISAFGELRAPLLPERWLPSPVKKIEADLAARYVVADTAQERNLAPTGGLKLDLAHGFSLRGSVSTSNRLQPAYTSRKIILPPSGSGGGGGAGEVSTTPIRDPIRGETYGVVASDAINPNLRPEASLTRTVGVIYQTGETHRIRAALDFAATRKSGEITAFDAQAVVNLEAFLPDRVIRAPLAPGDTHRAGAITSVATGAFNLAYRQSQNWNLSLDYAWNGFAGGTLEAYSRLTTFQRYDVQVNPDSPSVDELNSPDGAAPGVLRYRANFGAGWRNRAIGFGMDGHYFHPRILPPNEALAQGRDRIRAFWQFDAYVESDLAHWLPWQSSRYGLRAQLRVNNIMRDAFPPYASSPAGTGVQPYGDWRGRVVSLSLTATF